MKHSKSHLAFRVFANKVTSSKVKDSVQRVTFDHTLQKDPSSQIQ
jgi:hypothetical protein